MTKKFLPITLAVASMVSVSAGAQQVRPVVPQTTQEQQAAAPALQAGPASTPDYKIGPEDSLQISVWKEPTLSGTFPVRPDGNISLVLAGEVKAAGQTPAELTQTITEKLKKYIQDPLVTVVVTAVNSQKVFLLGEIQHVGQVLLTPGMTPLQAISAGGGLTAYANPRKVYILRVQNGKQAKIPFNYKDALKGNSPLLPLQSGDTIVVP